VSKATSTEMLRCESLSSGYDGALVVQDIALSVKTGEVFGILGKNGMGKSTLLKTLIGLVEPSMGRVHVNGNEVTGSKPYRIARLGVAYVPQEAAIFQDLTVEENLKLVVSSPKALSSAFEEINDYFPVIPTRRKQLAGTLSGGEQKMLLMTRALAIKPMLMLVDEVSEGLQPSMVGKFSRLFSDISRKNGTTVLLVEQNVGLLGQVAARVALLKSGQIARIERVADLADAQADLTDMLWD
jgi:branched-chain amino acid transport system ATP-binding protein